MASTTVKLHAFMLMLYVRSTATIVPATMYQLVLRVCFGCMYASQEIRGAGDEFSICVCVNISCNYSRKTCFEAVGGLDEINKMYNEELIMNNGLQHISMEFFHNY